jgi:hypothetical protein
MVTYTWANGPLGPAHVAGSLMLTVAIPTPGPDELLEPPHAMMKNPAIAAVDKSAAVQIPLIFIRLLMMSCCVFHT